MVVVTGRGDDPLRDFRIASRRLEIACARLLRDVAVPVVERLARWLDRQ